MKKCKLKICIISFCMIFALLFGFDINVYGSVSASSAIVITQETKEIIYEYNAYEQLSMASTTKIMTALIAAEFIEENSNQVVTVTSSAMAEGSSMGLAEGDVIDLYSLIIGMLLPSGNDAANMTAIHIAGSIEEFGVLMNEKASEIGMENSSFVTPSGLDADEHYTTAYDMALLMVECMNNEIVSYVMGMESMEVSYYSATENAVIHTTYENHNQLLSYDYITGGKTGYTSKSGRCLVSSAEIDGLKLIAVTLNDPNDWEDHIYMYEYAYSMVSTEIFEKEEILLPKAEGGYLSIVINEKTFALFEDDEVKKIIYLPRFVYGSSLEDNETIGYVCYYKNDTLIFRTEIIY